MGTIEIAEDGTRYTVDDEGIEHNVDAAPRGEILYDADGVWYWSPTGEAGTWSYPVTGDPVFTPEEAVNPFLAHLEDEVDVAALVADLMAAPLGRSQAEIDEMQAVEDEAATQAFLRTYNFGSWMSLQPRRFPTARVEAVVYA